MCVCVDHVFTQKKIDPVDSLIVHVVGRKRTNVFYLFEGHFFYLFSSVTGNEWWCAIHTFLLVYFFRLLRLCSSFIVRQEIQLSFVRMFTHAQS